MAAEATDFYTMIDQTRALANQRADQPDRRGRTPR
jgi:hypothetical protein